MRTHLLLTGAAVKRALEGRTQRAAPGERGWPASAGACLGRTWLHGSTCAIRSHFLRDNATGPCREVFEDPAHCRYTIKAVLALAMDPYADPWNMRRVTISTPASRQGTRSPSGRKLARQGTAGKVVFDHMPEADDRL